MYFERIIDQHLEDWAAAATHKPLLLRGARQVGKSWAVRHLGEKFEHFVEINFEKEPKYALLFDGDLNVNRICASISAMKDQPIVPGKTLLFLDEVQQCPRAIMSLRFFKEDYPELHVVAAGSLLEFAIQELPTFGVGRIQSKYMYPMTFNEFLSAVGHQGLLTAKQDASPESPLLQPLHDKLVELFRLYLLVGGMPEVVSKWVETNDFLACQEIQDSLLASYEDDFPKYKKKVDPLLLKTVLRSAAVQVGKKFVLSQVTKDYKADKIRQAVEMLILAGLLVPVTHTGALGLPLGSDANRDYRKLLLFDSGLYLRLLDTTFNNAGKMAETILTASADELVNKGPLAEMVAGLELQRHKSSNMRHELFYWQRQEKSSTAEVDYLESIDMTILPVEVKAGTQGGMKSLWIYMREKHLHQAIRCSLENFGSFDYSDPLEPGEVRHVNVVPLYAVGDLFVKNTNITENGRSFG